MGAAGARRRWVTSPLCHRDLRASPRVAACTVGAGPGPAFQSSPHHNGHGYLRDSWNDAGVSQTAELAQHRIVAASPVRVGSQMFLSLGCLKGSSHAGRKGPLRPKAWR